VSYLPQKQILVALEGPWCHYCGQVGLLESLTIDHVVPVSRGGLSRMSNLVLACVLCNRIKGSFWPWCDCAKCTRSVHRHVSMHGPAVRSRGAGAYRTSSW
jgi:hypothetical protein